MFAFDSDSKFFLFFRTAFYFLFLFSELLFTIFLLPMSYSLCLLETAIHRICHHLLAGLFSFCAVVPIFITFWGAPEFQGTYHSFVYFLTFSIFLKWILILLVQEKHRKTLYRFLLAKIKDGVRTPGIKTLNTTNR